MRNLVPPMKRHSYSLQVGHKIEKKVPVDIIVLKSSKYPLDIVKFLSQVPPKRQLAYVELCQLNVQQLQYFLLGKFIPTLRKGVYELIME